MQAGDADSDAASGDGSGCPSARADGACGCYLGRARPRAAHGRLAGLHGGGRPAMLRHHIGDDRGTDRDNEIEETLQ